MPGFIAALCAEHASWADDATCFDELPDGWRDLVRALFAGLAAVMAGAPGGRLRILQVKEKFGGLRVYRGPAEGTVLTDAHWAAIAALAAAAEARSFETCDACGAPGRLRVRAGWYATRCDAHAGAGSRILPGGPPHA